MAEPTTQAALFPILGGWWIPLDVIASHEQQAAKNHGQSLARLSERGGLSACEAVAVIENRPWRKMEPGESARRLSEHVATVLLAAETREQEHRQHVGRFLSDLYAIMIDPLADGEMRVEETCRLLLEQARKDRDTMHAAESQATALRSERDALREALNIIAHGFYARPDGAVEIAKAALSAQPAAQAETPAAKEHP